METELARLHRNYDYHANCEMYFVTAASKQETQDSKDVMLSKAAYHHEQADKYQAQIKAAKAI